MNRNLITRMGVATGTVAALIALVFVLVFDAAGDSRRASDDALHARDLAALAGELRAITEQADVAVQALRGPTRAQIEAELRRDRAALPALSERTRRMSDGDRERLRAAAAVDAALRAYLRVEVDPALRTMDPDSGSDAEADAALARLGARLDDLQRRETARVAASRESARSASHRAIVLAIAGVAGSALLIALLTTYLTQYIVVPLRRVGRAARRIASGDLSARVAEVGDAEPVELARSFNQMAEAMQRTQAALEQRNDELESALDQLASEKRRLETFYRVGEQLAEQLELDALSDRALRELADAAGAEVGALWVAADGADAAEGATPPVRLVATRGLDAHDVPATLGAADGLPGRALAEGRSVVADHGEAAMRVQAFGALLPVRTEAHVPLCHGGAVVGVLSLGSVGTLPRTAVETVERLADQAAVAFANVLSYRDAQRRARITRAVLDATPDAIALYGRDGAVLVQNTPMAALAEELGGAPLPAVPGDGEVQDELCHGTRTLARYAAPVGDAAGNPMGRILVLRDVSAERESERLKDEFFALVSHELRTPLTSIIGYLELVLDDEEELGTDVRRFLEVVERNARRLLRLVGDMLFVVQVEAGRLSLEHAPVDLSALAAESVEAARPAAERAGVELELKADAAITVVGDRDRFGQMLDNLVSNAVKFTPPGGRVVVRTIDQDDRTVVEVADTGPGIPADEQEHLFERFFRSAAANSAAVPGVGLGLTIVKTIAEGHGGTVHVDSREGAGTTVRVELPRALVAA